MADVEPTTHLPGLSRCLGVFYVFLVSPFLLPPLLLLLLGGLPGVAEGQVLQCAGTDGCRCTMDDGTVIDVSSLGNQDGTPRFDSVLGTDYFYYYSFNPCFGFSQGSCSDAAVCQLSSDKQTTYQAGNADTAIWSYDGINAVVYYDNQDRDLLRQSFVTYKCDPTATTPTFSATGEFPSASGMYYFDVTTKCACPNACASASGGGDGDKGGGLSAGSVLTIIFFVLLVVYLLAGVVFNKTQRQATGTDVIPNVTFWRALPGLVKEGFLFVFSKVRPGRSGYSEV